MSIPNRELKMKRLSKLLLTAAITLSLPLGIGTNVLAQDAAPTPNTDSPHTDSQGNSFSDLLEKLEKQEEEKKKKEELLSSDFDFPVPPIKPYQNPIPWGADNSIFLESNSDGSIRHTISEFVCPASIKKVPLEKAWIQNETGATAHCNYSSQSENFVLVIDSIGGRAADLDAIVEATMKTANKAPKLKSKTLSMGKTSADCRHDSAVDPKGINVSMFACHYGAYVFKMLSLGVSSKKAESAFKKIVKNQKDFVATRELCVSHLEAINNMEPSGATGRPLLATSVEYQKNGPTCFFTATLSPTVKAGFNQIIYTFPENPDTPLMMTLHRNDGRLIKTFRLQHAFAREADRDEKPAVYNLIKTEPDGTHVVYSDAYTRILPIPRFFSESMKADTGKTKEKLELKRNAAGGFDMIMK